MSSIVTQSLPLPLVKRSRGGEHRCIVPGALGGAREVGKARLAAEIVEIGVDRRALEPGREPEPAHRLLTDHRGIAPAQPPRAPRLADQRRAVIDQRSEEHTSELQSLMRISYAVFCLKKKNNINQMHINLPHISI